MKRLITSITLTAVLSITSSSVKAQRLFDALPEKASFLTQVIENSPKDSG
jgi:hypothetical protein